MWIGFMGTSFGKNGIWNKEFPLSLGIKFSNQRLKEGWDFIKWKSLIKLSHANWLGKSSLMIMVNGSRLLRLSI